MFTAYTFLLALFLSAALIPLLVRIASRAGMVDMPAKRKVHPAPIPRIGGIAIVIGMLVPVLLWVPLRPDIEAYLIAVAVLTLFGVIDDKVSLDYRLKFLGQFIAASIVVLYGDVSIVHFPYVPNEELTPWVSIPLTVVVLVGVTNAVNLSDGLDGLAGGTSVLAIGFFGLLAYQIQDMTVVQVALAIVGATLGFLRFNTHPARVFMGDTGSQFLGFSAGVLALVVTQISNPALSPVLPILILGLPLLDTLWVMVGRILNRCSPFAPDRTHIHHRLLDFGLTQYEAVAIIYTLQAALILTAYYLRYSLDSYLLAIYLLFCVSVVLLINHARRLQYHFHHLPHEQRPLMRMVAYLKISRATIKIPSLVLRPLVPLFLVTGSLLAEHVDQEVGILALALCSMLLIVLQIRFIPFFLLERITLFTTATSVVYLLEISPGFISCCGHYLHLLFGLIVFFVAAWVRFAGSHFQFNTMDFLIVIIMVLLPNLPEFRGVSWGMIGIGSIIMFYAIEVLMVEEERRWDMLRSGALLALGILSVRGLLF